MTEHTLSEGPKVPEGMDIGEAIAREIRCNLSTSIYNAGIVVLIRTSLTLRDRTIQHALWQSKCNLTAAQ